MSYNTGTLAAGSNAAQNLMTTIQPLIDAHAGWQFVESVVATTRTVDIFKCLGTVNSMTVDYFVGIGRSTDSGNVYVMIAENYDGSGKTFTNSLYYSTSTLTVNADGTNNLSATPKHVVTASTINAVASGNIFGVGNMTTTPATTSPTGVTISPSAPWFLSVTNDAIVLSCGSLSVYIGIYDSSYNTTIDPRPLCAMVLAPFGYTPTPGTSQAAGFTLGFAKFGGYTRDLGGATSLTYAGAGYVNGGLIRHQYTATPSIAKDPVSGNWLAQRVAIGSAARNALRRGLLKSHVLAIPMPEVTMGIGDTITVDGVQHVCVLPHTVSPQIANVDSIWVSTVA